MLSFLEESVVLLIFNQDFNCVFFQYVILAPSVVHSLYSMLAKDKSERDITNFLILPFLLWRMLHNQIWITLSRHRTAKGNGRIVDKGIEFDQVDRERNWSVSVNQDVFNLKTNIL